LFFSFFVFSPLEQFGHTIEIPRLNGDAKFQKKMKLVFLASTQWAVKDSKPNSRKDDTSGVQMNFFLN